MGPKFAYSINGIMLKAGALQATAGLHCTCGETNYIQVVFGLSTDKIATGHHQSHGGDDRKTVNVELLQSKPFCASYKGKVETLCHSFRTWWPDMMIKVVWFIFQEKYKQQTVTQDSADS